MFILGGTCRLIAEIESGDRSVKRTRVVPLNIKQDHQKHEVTTQKSTGQIPVNAGPIHPKAGASKEPQEDVDEPLKGLPMHKELLFLLHAHLVISSPPSCTIPFSSSLLEP